MAPQEFLGSSLFRRAALNRVYHHLVVVGGFCFHVLFKLLLAQIILFQKQFKSLIASNFQFQQFLFRPKVQTNAFHINSFAKLFKEGSTAET